MSIPIEQITEGVYELTAPSGTREVVVVKPSIFGTRLVCHLSESACGSPKEWANRGFEFTRRYIPCAGEPIECVCPCCHGNGRVEMLEHCAACGGSGRGLFIPQEPSGALREIRTDFVGKSRTVPMQVLGTLESDRVDLHGGETKGGE